MKYTIKIDDTLLYSELKDGRYNYFGCNKYLIDITNKLFTDENLVILYTEKEWDHLDDILRALKKYKIKYDTVLMGAPPLDYCVEWENDKQ